MTKSLFPTETLSASSSILVFCPEGAARHLCLSLNASHSFLNFGETVGFHPLFASYFILHNGYIRILTIHRCRASPKALVSLMSFLKKRKRKKLNPTETLCTSSSILVFYLGGAAVHLCLAVR